MCEAVEVSEPILEHERLHELVSHAPSFDLEEDAMLELGVHRPRLRLLFAASVLRSENPPHKQAGKVERGNDAAKNVFSDAMVNLKPLSFSTYWVAKHW